MARPSPGARRVATVLEFLASRPDERFTLSELARSCDLNKATAHALLTELTATGFLLRHPEEKRYSLGPRLVPVGRAAEQGYRSRDFRAGPLRRLAEATGTVAAAVALGPHGDQASVIDSVGVGPTLPVPLHWMLSPPNGAVFFAWADERDVEAWLARSPAGQAVHNALGALEATRRHGVTVGLAVPPWRRLMLASGWRREVPGSGAKVSAKGNGSRDGDSSHRSSSLRDVMADLAAAESVLTELDDGVTYPVAYVAAPVFDTHGLADLALVIGWSDGRSCTPAEVRELSAQVVKAADSITEASHGRRPLPRAVPSRV